MVPRHQPLGGGIQSSDKLRFEVRVQSVGFSVRRILEVGGRLIHMQGRLQGRKGRWGRRVCTTMQLKGRRYQTGIAQVSMTLIKKKSQQKNGSLLEV